jgi:hypothetical protein
MEVGRLANYSSRTRSITDQILRPGLSRPSFYTAWPLSRHSRYLPKVSWGGGEHCFVISKRAATAVFQQMYLANTVVAEVCFLDMIDGRNR